MALYDVVVDALRAANGIGTDDDASFATLLQSLIPSLESL